MPRLFVYGFRPHGPDLVIRRAGSGPAGLMFDTPVLDTDFILHLRRCYQDSRG